MVRSPDLYPSVSTPDPLGSRYWLQRGNNSAAELGTPWNQTQTRRLPAGGCKSQVIGDLTERCRFVMKAKLSFAFLCLPKEGFHSLLAFFFFFNV